MNTVGIASEKLGAQTKLRSSSASTCRRSRLGATVGEKISRAVGRITRFNAKRASDSYFSTTQAPCEFFPKQQLPAD